MQFTTRHVNSQHIHTYTYMYLSVNCHVSVLSKHSRTLTCITLLLKFTLLTLNMNFPLLHNTQTSMHTFCNAHVRCMHINACAHMLARTQAHSHTHTLVHPHPCTHTHALWWLRDITTCTRCIVQCTSITIVM